MENWLSKLPRHCSDRILNLIDSDDLFQIAIAYPDKCKSLIKNVKKIYVLKLFKPLSEIRQEIDLMNEVLLESISSIKVVIHDQKNHPKYIYYKNKPEVKAPDNPFYSFWPATSDEISSIDAYYPDEKITVENNYFNLIKQNDSTFSNFVSLVEKDKRVKNLMQNYVTNLTLFDERPVAKTKLHSFSRPQPNKPSAAKVFEDMHCRMTEKQIAQLYLLFPKIRHLEFIHFKSCLPNMAHPFEERLAFSDRLAANFYLFHANEFIPFRLKSISFPMVTELSTVDCTTATSFDFNVHIPVNGLFQQILRIGNYLEELNLSANLLTQESGEYFRRLINLKKLTINWENLLSVILESICEDLTRPPAKQLDFCWMKFDSSITLLPVQYLDRQALIGKFISSCLSKNVTNVLIEVVYYVDFRDLSKQSCKKFTSKFEKGGFYYNEEIQNFVENAVYVKQVKWW